MNEQRLIDANALRTRFKHYAIDCRENDDETSAEVWEDCITELDGAPTIEPKRGEWIGDYKAQCSKCGYFDTSAAGFPKPNYCKSCGADMREGKK